MVRAVDEALRASVARSVAAAAAEVAGVTSADAMVTAATAATMRAAWSWRAAASSAWAVATRAAADVVVAMVAEEAHWRSVMRTVDSAADTDALAAWACWRAA